MAPNFTKALASPLEQELFKQEKKYKKAIKAAVAEPVLKEIRNRLSILKSELGEQKMHARNK